MIINSHKKNKYSDVCIQFLLPIFEFVIATQQNFVGWIKLGVQATDSSMRSKQSSYILFKSINYAQISMSDCTLRERENWAMINSCDVQMLVNRRKFSHCRQNIGRKRFLEAGCFFKFRVVHAWNGIWHLSNLGVSAHGVSHRQKLLDWLKYLFTQKYSSDRKRSWVGPYSISVTGKLTTYNNKNVFAKYRK